MISIMCNYDQLLQNCKISQLRQTTAVSYRKEQKRKWIIKGLKNRKSYRLNKLNNNQI